MLTKPFDILSIESVGWNPGSGRSQIFSQILVCGKSVPLFQAGAQMMEVLGSELDHRLPPDWSGSPISMAAMLVWAKLQS